MKDIKPDNSGKEFAEKTIKIIDELNIPITFLEKQTKVYEYKIQELQNSHKREIKYWKKNFLSCLIALVAVTIVAVVIIIIYAR